MKEVDFQSDAFEDVLAIDDRYSPRAYAFLVDVLDYLGKEGKHFSACDILEEFKEYAIDQYGPMSYTVMREWGLKECPDVGNMMKNLVTTHRIAADENDHEEDFVGVYDFEEVFLRPYDA